MKRFIPAFGIAGMLALAAPLAQAAPVTYTAALSGANEEPQNGSAGTGQATVVLDLDPAVYTMQIQASFSGLEGATTVAHIHCCTAAPSSGTASVATQLPSFALFPAGVTSGSYSQTFDLGDLGSWSPAFVTANGGTPAGALDAFLAGLSGGQAYFNIHTQSYPSGEIRGFLVQEASVPEPATLALLGAALLVVAIPSVRGKARRPHALDH